MLYIIDNGQGYSDHTIYFVEVAPKEEKVLALVLELLAISSSKFSTPHTILLQTNSVEWRQGSSMTLAKFIEGHRSFAVWEKEDEVLKVKQAIKSAWIEDELEEPIPANILDTEE